MRHMFRFATQLIYKDGEESAVSPYSEIAVSSTLGLVGLDDDLDLTGKDYLTGTMYWTLIPYSSSESNDHEYRPEVIAVRLLGRDQNNGAWVVVDEFNPNEDLRRRVYGSNMKVFDKVTKVYTFYNEGVYGAVPALKCQRPMTMFLFWQKVRRSWGTELCTPTTRRGDQTTQSLAAVSHTF